MNNANPDRMLAHQIFLKGQIDSGIMGKWEFKDYGGKDRVLDLSGYVLPMHCVP